MATSSPDLSASVLSWLDKNAHEDWCPRRLHAQCCALNPSDCECRVGPMAAALRGVAEAKGCADPERADSYGAGWTCGYNVALRNVQSHIAEALGVLTAAPARIGRGHCGGPVEHPRHTYDENGAATLCSGRPVDEHVRNADSGLPTVACLLTEDTDMEAFAALPECGTGGGTGKDTAGSPWAPGGEVSTEDRAAIAADTRAERTEDAASGQDDENWERRGSHLLAGLDAMDRGEDQ